MNEIIYPLAGGAIIGISATVLLLFNGKIAGISGIVKSSLTIPNSDGVWRYTFILGLIIGGLITRLIAPELFDFALSFTNTEAIIAGLFVGVGTAMGSGCTSGHGVCGLPRLSTRSLAATITFMLIAGITVYLKGIL
jgi:uncharacterized membrane protein YedE/YeeE